MLRTRLVLVVLSLLALVSALGPGMPATTQAAPAMASQQSTITGTLVATPQVSLPATLLLQVGGQTLPVTVSSSTQIVRNDSSVATPADLRDGDTLQVTGSANQAGGIDATLIVDLSLPGTSPATVTVQGVLAAAPSSITTPPSGVLCLQNASVIGSAVKPNATVVSPCPAGQLPVYLTGSTSIVNSGNQAIGTGGLHAGDTLQVTGTVSNAQFTASLIVDLSVAAPTVTVQVQGVLAAAPSVVTTPPSGVLCLQNASVIGSAITPNAAVVSPCPAAQLPVYLTGSTSIVNSGNQAIGLGGLLAGHTLLVTGTVSNGQLTASVIVDLSVAAAVPPPVTTVQVQGVLAAAPSSITTPPSGVLCLQNASVIGSAITPNAAVASPCPAAQLPIYLTGSTSIVNSGNQAISLGGLLAGHTLLVTGTVSNGQLTASVIVDLSVAAATSPTVLKVTVQGVLVTTPAQLNAPLTLCLRNVRLISGLKRLRVFVSPCAAGQLSVYVTAGPKIVRRFNGASGLDELQAGDTLQVAGTFSNGRFTATLIRDLSIQALYTTLVGTVLYASPSTQPAYLIVRVQRDVLRPVPFALGGVLTIYVQARTQIITAGGTTGQVSSLSPGQTVTVLGVYNQTRRGFVTALRVRIH